jgi:hypothetical protein
VAAVSRVTDVTARRWLALAAAALLCACLGGCSSGGSSGGSSQAQAERTSVLAAAKTLNSQVPAAGVGWSGTVTGLYGPCGQSDPLATGQGVSGMVQYTATQLMSPFNGGVPLSTFGRQMVEVLNAEGWGLKPLAVAGATNGTTWYTGRKGGFDLRVENFADGSLGATSTIDLSGSCFNAGSGAQSLEQSTNDMLNMPKPTVTPAPKYS